MWRVVPGVIISMSLASGCADEEPSLQQDQNAATGATSATPAQLFQPTSGAAPDICTESAARSAAALRAAVAQADAACTRAEDCAIVWPTTSCHADCWVVLSQAGALQLEQSTEQLSAECASFDAVGCSRVVPSCDPQPTAACVAGACRPLAQLTAP